MIMGITFFIGAASEGVDRLWEAHLIRDVGLPDLFGLDPVVWFGLINVVGLLAGIVDHLLPDPPLRARGQRRPGARADAR